MRKLLAAIVAASLLIPVVASPAAAIIGICSTGQLPDGQTQHIFVKREVSPAYPGFDYVRGDAYARDLEVCVSGSMNGGTFILPANVEANNGTIFQLAYGKRATDSAIHFFWVAAPAGTEPTARLITTVEPVLNVRYRFIITRNSSGYPLMQIIRLDTSATVWSYTPSVYWPADLRRAWWGGERWEKVSNFGVAAANADIQMAYMGYSQIGDGTIYYRSGMTSSDVINNSGDTSKYHGHIGTWVYGGDMLNIETH